MTSFKLLQDGVLIGPYNQLWFRKDLVTLMINRDPKSGLFLDTAEYNRLSLTTKAIEIACRKLEKDNKRKRKISMRAIPNNEINFRGHKKPSGRPPLYISEGLYYLLEEYYQRKRETTSPFLLDLAIYNFLLPFTNPDAEDINDQFISNYEVEKFRKYLGKLNYKISLNEAITSNYNKTIITTYKCYLENLMNFVTKASKILKDESSADHKSLQSHRAQRLLEKAIGNFSQMEDYIGNLHKEFEKGKFNPDWYFENHPNFKNTYFRFHYNQIGND